MRLLPSPDRPGYVVIPSSERYLLQYVTADPIGPAILVSSARYPDAPPRLFATPDAGIATFVSDDVVFAAHSFLVHLGPSGDKVVPFKGSSVVIDPNGKLIAGVRDHTHLAILDAGTLDELADLRAPESADPRADPSTKFVNDRLLFSEAAGAEMLVDTKNFSVLDDPKKGGCPGDLWRVSRSGRKAAGICASPPAIEIVDVETARVMTVPIAGLPAFFGLAISADDMKLAYSSSPDEVLLVALADGQSHPVKTSNVFKGKGYDSLATTELAFSGDGTTLCGHPYFGRDTGCENLVYLDIRKTVTPSRDTIAHCFIDDGVAYPVSVKVPELFLDGRVPFPGGMGESHACNEVLSPDHTTMGIVTVKPPKPKTMQYLDGAMNLVDVATGNITTKSPLGDEPEELEPQLSSRYGEDGRALDVAFGGCEVWYDVATGKAIDTPITTKERRTLIPLGKPDTDGCVVKDASSGQCIAHIPHGEAWCFDGTRLTPPSACSE